MIIFINNKSTKFCQITLRIKRLIHRRKVVPFFYLTVYTSVCTSESWGADVVICLERGVDLHMAQLMPLPLTVSCFSKIQIGFTFLVPAHLGSPGKRAVKCVCVCVCMHQPLRRSS